MIFDPAFKQVQCLFELWHKFPVVHLSMVEWLQASASTSVYKFDSIVRGQHVHKSVWTSLTDWCSKTCKCIPVQEDD